jgi:hypothetical protein
MNIKFQISQTIRQRPEGLGEILNLLNPSGPRNEYWKHKKKLFLGSKVRRERGADNITAIYEPIV